MKIAMILINSLVVTAVKYTFGPAPGCQPLDPGVPKRPIRFKLSVRTGNPLLWVSQNLPANQAIGRM